MRQRRIYRLLISVGLMLLPLLNQAAEQTQHTNSLNQAYQYIPSGEFMMGTADLDELAFELPDGRFDQVQDETPAHGVTISKGFYLAITEVTQGQWLELMKTKPGPEVNWNRSDWARLPVVSVSWHMTQSFIAELNKKEPGRHYRLPTEAEWEYAARAGSKGLRPFEREDLPAYAWFIENSGDVAQPVAGRKPNNWGLYDLFGNAWEWVEDRYQGDYYARAAGVDPKGPAIGEKRLRRGGSYHCKPHLVRSAYRAADLPGKRYSVLGFRLVLEENR